MKYSIYLCMAAAAGTSLWAEEQTAATPAPLPTLAENAAVQLPVAKLEELLGPIALYPDALVAIILPASTVPSDVVLAARYLNEGGADEGIDAEPWDDSVKSLARYPEIIKWLDANLAWTKQLGEAFAAQPADVMNAVQRLRAKARENGALVDTPQQKVIVEDENIIIAPAQPDVIYVPYYDPDVVYVRNVYYTDPFITFGIGFSAGWWLGYGLDWHYHRVWCIDPVWRHRYWHDRHAHYHWHHVPNHRLHYHQDPHFQAWRPRAGYPRPMRQPGVGQGFVQRDTPRPSAFPRDHYVRTQGAADSARFRAAGAPLHDAERAPVNRGMRRPGGDGAPVRSGPAPYHRTVVPSTAPVVQTDANGVGTSGPRVRPERGERGMNREPNAPHPERPRVQNQENRMARPGGSEPGQMTRPRNENGPQSQAPRPSVQPRPERSTVQAQPAPTPRPQPRQDTVHSPRPERSAVAYTPPSQSREHRGHESPRRQPQEEQR